MFSNEKVATSTMDRLGVVASVGCAIHCMAMPLVVSLSAVYAHLLPTEEHTHRVLAVVVSCVGAIALGRGYKRHRRFSPLLLMAAGLCFIVGGAVFGDRLPTHLAEVAVTMAGSCCMIAAHRKNHTFCRDCERCG